jgi:hypothetical protein
MIIGMVIIAFHFVCKFSVFMSRLSLLLPHLVRKYKNSPGPRPKIWTLPPPPTITRHAYQVL